MEFISTQGKQPSELHRQNDTLELSQHYQLIEQAIQYIEANVQRQPELDEIASAIGLSEYHFQRLFTRWAGISPKRFMQFLTKEHAKELLARSENLLDTTHQVGLSSLGRLHDLFVNTEAVTPGEYKSHGAGSHHPLRSASHPIWKMSDRHHRARHLPFEFCPNQRRQRD